MKIKSLNLRRWTSVAWLLFLATVIGNGSSLQRAVGQVNPARTVALGKAQTAESEVPDQADPHADIEQSRREITSMISRVKNLIEAFKQDHPGQPTPESLSIELELYKWLDLLYSDRSASTIRLTELEEELERVVVEIETLSLAPIVEGKRFSFLALEDLRDQLKTEVHRRESIKLEIEAARSSLESIRDSHDSNEAKRRMFREDVATSDNDEQLNHRYALAKLRSRATGEAVANRELELKINEFEHQISEKRHVYFESQINRMHGRVVFSQAELEQRIKFTDEAEAELRTQLESALAGLSELEREYLLASRALENAAVETPQLVEEAATWRLLRELNQEHVSVLQRVIGYAGTIRIIWRRRFDLANQLASKDDLAKWQLETENLSQQITQFQHLLKIRADERVSDLTSVRKRLVTSTELHPEVREFLSRQSEALENSINAYNSQIVLVTTGERTLGRFREELDLTLDPRSAEEFLARSWQLILMAWNYEITSVEDRPITVGKIIWGTILLLAGIYSARIFSRLLGMRILPRFGLNPGASVAFQSIAFYLMATCFGFFALEIINVPLTVFAFMGGAIAIGIGFGSQNVLNNFISGLIMLAERPIRVGDLVDIDDLNGVIERIGARSTRVKTGSNLEIIVPNSKFLENNVTNWTLSDTRIRTVVKVGVAYGSPVNEVRNLLREAVLGHEGVLGTPEPIILFKDFGDNALAFEAHFWIHMRTVMEGERIASDVRVAIDEMFEKANITISFPQRDVHIDTLSPIEVNLRQVDGESGMIHRRAA